MGGKIDWGALEILIAMEGIDEIELFIEHLFLIQQHVLAQQHGE